MTTNEEHGNGADVAVKIAGQEVNIKNVKSLNTLATMTTLVVAILIAYGGWMHSTEAKENNKDIAKELKEVAKAAREQNCLLSLPQERRQENVEVCKRISR